MLIKQRTNRTTKYWLGRLDALHHNTKFKYSVQMKEIGLIFNTIFDTQETWSRWWNTHVCPNLNIYSSTFSWWPCICSENRHLTVNWGFSCCPYSSILDKTEQKFWGTHIRGHDFTRGEMTDSLLTHCTLMTLNFSQHWLSWWVAAWRHQAINWTSVD